MKEEDINSSNSSNSLFTKMNFRKRITIYSNNYFTNNNMVCKINKVKKLNIRKNSN